VRVLGVVACWRFQAVKSLAKGIENHEAAKTQRNESRPFLGWVFFVPSCLRGLADNAMSRVQGFKGRSPCLALKELCGGAGLPIADDPRLFKGKSD
jgi:hypothetical protein